MSVVRKTESRDPPAKIDPAARQSISQKLLLKIQFANIKRTAIKPSFA